MLVSVVRSHRPLGRERGVALAIIVWFIAALSLLVGGIVLQARMDLKMTQLHANQARVAALGDGAIALVLAQWEVAMQNGEPASRSGYVGSAELGGYSVVVELLPVSGLIDLNAAPQPLLEALFRYALTRSPDLAQASNTENVAQALAANVIEWRSAAGSLASGDDSAEASEYDGELDSFEIRYGRFEAVEDLLLVPGINRALFNTLKELVHVSGNGQPGVDWQAAPAAVLGVLGVESSAAEALRQQLREGNVEGASLPENLDQSLLGESTLPTFRADARVSIDGSVFLRRRWVERNVRGIDGLPWRVYRTESVRALQGNTESAVSEGDLGR